MTRQERIKKRQQVTSGLTFNTLSVIVALMWTLNVTALIIGNITVTNLICDKSYSDLQETMEIALEDIDKSALEESIESENWDDSKIQNGFEKMKFVMKRQEISKCFLIIETPDLPSKYHTIYSVVGEDVDDIEKIGKEEFGVEKEALDEAVNDIFRGDLPGAALTKDLYSLSDTPYSMLIGS